MSANNYVLSTVILLSLSQEKCERQETAVNARRYLARHIIWHCDRLAYCKPALCYKVASLVFGGKGRYVEISIGGRNLLFVNNSFADIKFK